MNFERITVLILFIALIVVFYRYQQKFEINENSFRDYDADLLLNALLYADHIEGRIFPSGVFLDINNSRELSISHRPTLLLLFSLSDCNKCLSTEVEFLNKFLAESNDDFKVDILGISLDSGDSLPRLRKYKKIYSLDFPISWDRDEVIKKWMPNGSYPLVLLLDKNRKIIRAHKPVVGDTLLVQSNFKALERHFLN